MAPLLFALAALIGFVVATVRQPAPVAVIKLAPVELALTGSAQDSPVQLEVERVTLEPPSLSTPAFASIEEVLPAVTAKAAGKPVKKSKRSLRRSREEAPVPPWLVKRNRR